MTSKQKMTIGFRLTNDTAVLGDMRLRILATLFSILVYPAVIRQADMSKIGSMKPREKGCKLRSEMADSLQK